MCDISGNILYEKTPFAEGKDELSPYVANLYKNINNSSINRYSNSIRGFAGKKREVYYSRVSNGWLCVLTVPNATLIK